ncbi:biosynthetic-type acetolactate synthase large subunit [Lentibacillus daqui]|uniref:biosynthetic-type acetolactate synthase large subunit n=1 Tax=Lentibacillus daqui TaxID=2911514 RepID=UPI003F700BD9
MKAEVECEFVKSEKTMTGAELLIESLVEAEVDTLFGYPGGAVLPIYDALYRSNAPFKHILPRHEQGAVHAAEGYARVTGKPGVVLATSGPGATNLVTGIADAMMDSLPLVIFTGQVGSNVIGTDAFQETDVMGVTTPITKYNCQLKQLSDLPRVVKEAFHIASTGRPGPVVVDIPKNISTASLSEKCNSEVCLPGYQPTTKPNPLQIIKLTDALANAKRPVVLAGAGVLFGGASTELKQFVDQYQLPVTTTLLGLGSFPGTNPLNLGMAGMHGTYAANMAIYECDLLINIGARFDDRLTGSLEHFAPNAKVAHIDIDPAEIGKNVLTDIPVVSDAKEGLLALLNQSVNLPQHEEWKQHLQDMKQEFPLWYERSGDLLSPQWLIEEVYRASNGEAIITTDVGQHQMWAAQYYLFDKPNKWVTSGGLGTMGFGFPAAIGAQLGAPDELVVAIVGDGGFQMTMQELSMIKDYQLPVKILIVNNGSLGMVRQWQEKFYDERYSESIISSPDFVKLAESYGISGVRVDKEADVPGMLNDIFANDDPVVVDCRVTKMECVFPMVPSGKGNHEMIGVKK